MTRITREMLTDTIDIDTFELRGFHRLVAGSDAVLARRNRTQEERILNAIALVKAGEVGAHMVALNVLTTASNTVSLTMHPTISALFEEKLELICQGEGELALSEYLLDIALEATRQSDDQNQKQG